MRRFSVSIVLCACLVVGLSAFMPPSIYGCGGVGGATGCKTVGTPFNLDLAVTVLRFLFP